MKVLLNKISGKYISRRETELKWTGSGFYPVACFNIIGVETAGSVTRNLVK